MCILELSKVLMYEFYYDYIKNKYDNKSELLFADTDRLMYVKLKQKMSTKILAAIKKRLILVIIRLSQNTMMILKKLVIGKRKDETSSVAIEELVRLNPKMYSFLVENNKAKDANKNVVATTIHNDYKDILLNKESIRHSMNRIQFKDHRIGTCEINKISLFYFDNKIDIENISMTD